MAARASALIALLCATILRVAAQIPAREAAATARPLPTISISGRVVAADTSDPIRNARVSMADVVEAPAALTDAEGRFTLVASADDKSRLSASKTGYVNTSAPALPDVEIRLTRGGVIAGRVLDDRGQPMPLMNVAAFRRRGSERVTFERFRATETDDQGEYRLFDLPSGEFVIAAAPGRFGTATATIPVGLDLLVFHNYYPHAETPETAQPIAVRPGVETPGIDLTVALPPFGPPMTSSGPRPAAPLFAPQTGGTAAIRGRVVTADGIPIRRAQVWLNSAERLFAPYFKATDDEGRYEFPGLRAGSYAVVANTLAGDRTPFTLSSGGSGPELLTLAAGAALDYIDIAIPRRGAIGGRILDEYGEPMANANVRVEAVVFARGRRRLVPVQGIVSRQTNDLGRYRIFGLRPGRYVVGAVVGEKMPGWDTAEWPGYARTYFPGTPVPAEAQIVELSPGQQALTVDFPLVRGHIARVAGTALLSNAQPLRGVVSLMQSARSGAIATAPVSVHTEEDGRFEFVRIPPGEYVLQAATSRSTVSTEGEFASQYVTVDGVDVAGLAVQLSAGSTIEGRLSFEGAEPPPDPDFHLSPVPVDSDLTSLIDNAPARADIHDDWTFDITGINGPRRLRLTQAPDGWALKAVRVNGVDATDAVLPFGTAEESLRDVEVIITNRVTEISVKPGGPARSRPADFRVIAYATDRAQRDEGSRYFAIAAPGPGGTATLRGLPPGDYYVAALGADAQPDWAASEPTEFLESIGSAAIRVTLTEGQHVNVTVPVLDALVKRP